MSEPTMPRAPRIQIAGLTFHIVHRGNHRARVFFVDDDYRSYLHLLALMSSRYQTKIHAYVLMTNHVHLLMTAARPDGVSRTMQNVAGCYARIVNERLDRQGALWEGRFRSSLIDSEYYCLACYRYIELNPVRAGIVAWPAEYRWSSHNENIGQRALRIVEPHDSFMALGIAPQSRCENYRSLLAEALPDKTLATIREGMRQGLPICSDPSASDHAPDINIDVGPRRRGRPRKVRFL
jgi:putative transposase